MHNDSKPKRIYPDIYSAIQDMIDSINDDIDVIKNELNSTSDDIIKERRAIIDKYRNMIASINKSILKNEHIIDVLTRLPHTTDSNDSDTITDENETVEDHLPHVR